MNTLYSGTFALGIVYLSYCMSELVGDRTKTTHSASGAVLRTRWPCQGSVERGDVYTLATPGSNTARKPSC